MALEAGQKAVRTRIYGRVQGVWYRGWTVDNAKQRGLSGWVRNRRDGSVEALFAGSADAVDEMVDACRQGPPSARVDEVEVSSAVGITEPGFVQKPTV